MGLWPRFRQRLDGHWGMRDAADMEDAALYLAGEGLADREQLMISGSSAGGYTVLMALARSNIFAAGASYYGISDMALLLETTHKFEAGYINMLLGLDGHEDDGKHELLRQRSPLHMCDRISAPVIFFQGMKDKVVPPAQSRAMHEALTRQGISSRLVTFAEEGHGFRSSEAITTALEQELRFYTRYTGRSGNFAGR